MVQNVLFITHHDGYLGSSKSLLNLLQGLSTYPIQPYVIVPKKGLFTDALDRENIPNRILPIAVWATNKPYSLLRKINWIKEVDNSTRAIIKAVDDWEIDIIYSNSSIFPSGRFAAFQKKIPHIWHIREFGDLDYSLTYLASRRISLSIIKSSTKIICNSDAVKQYLFNDKTKEINVIYNGITSESEFDSYIQCQNIRKPNQTYIFCMIGSLSAKKGVDAAIRAVSRLVSEGMSLRLILAGSGQPEFVNHCKNLVKTLNIVENVNFLDYVLDPYTVYSESDCLLMCSEFEAFGRVTVEAMSSCLPVIGKNSGGTPEIIENGKTGLLYNTFEELVTCMNRMIQNPEWGKQLGINGWNLAKSKFCIENYARNVYQVIESVTNG